MVTIAALHRKVVALDIQQVAIDAVTQTKEAIADLNVEQMNQGLKADGKFFPDYSPVSVAVFGKRPGPMTMRNTGDFQAGEVIDVKGVSINITSTDWKTAKLVKKYGKIFGLSEKYRYEYVRESLRPAFAKRISDLTGLKIGI